MNSFTEKYNLFENRETKINDKKLYEGTAQIQLKVL